MLPPFCIALGAVTAVGCAGAGANRAGGDAARTEPVGLTFSNSFSADNFPRDAAVYAAAVEDATAGTIRFELTGGVVREAEMVEQVAAGDVDLAVIRPRVFDTLGVADPAALMAPLLIDSYELEQAVYETELPQGLLGSLDALGVVGVAVIPGPLFKLVGFDREFRGVDDFDGAVIGTISSLLQADTFRRLRATPQEWPVGESFEGLDGIPLHWGTVLGRHAELTAKAVTTNLNMWVGPMVVIVNPDVHASLTEDQRAAFGRAASTSVAGIVETTRRESSGALETLCASGLHVVVATDRELAGIRAALKPIYDELRSDPDVAAYLDEVEALKNELAAPPDAERCP
jgi:TRAP-type C4-dicarboxylate transport system substrate-binding protein